MCLFRALLRGGLAEQADRLFSRSSTNFSLWQAGFVKQLEGAKQTKEDLRLHIVSILSFTRNTTADALPRSAIARCSEVLQDASDRTESNPQEGTVVFLFAKHDRVSSPVNFQEGKDVRVWQPWQEIELPEVLNQLDSPAKEVRTLPNSQVPAAGKRTALLCSRFLVVI
jgi:hypothetical protein